MRLAPSTSSRNRGSTTTPHKPFVPDYTRCTRGTDNDYESENKKGKLKEKNFGNDEIRDTAGRDSRQSGR